MGQCYVARDPGYNPKTDTGKLKQVGNHTPVLLNYVLEGFLKVFIVVVLVLFCFLLPGLLLATRCLETDFTVNTTGLNRVGRGFSFCILPSPLAEAVFSACVCRAGPSPRQAGRDVDCRSSLGA